MEEKADLGLLTGEDRNVLDLALEGGRYNIVRSLLLDSLSNPRDLPEAFDETLEEYGDWIATYDPTEDSDETSARRVLDLAKMLNVLKRGPCENPETNLYISNRTAQLKKRGFEGSVRLLLDAKAQLSEE